MNRRLVVYITNLAAMFMVAPLLISAAVLLIHDYTGLGVAASITAFFYLASMTHNEGEEEAGAACLGALLFGLACGVGHLFLHNVSISKITILVAAVVYAICAIIWFVNLVIEKRDHRATATS
jgi:hypothetical protein